MKYLSNKKWIFCMIAIEWVLFEYLKKAEVCILFIVNKLSLLFFLILIKKMIKSEKISYKFLMVELKNDNLLVIIKNWKSGLFPKWIIFYFFYYY